MEVFGLTPRELWVLARLFWWLVVPVLFILVALAYGVVVNQRIKRDKKEAALNAQNALDDLHGARF